MTMESVQQNRINDEFGYQRFALTEAAYDLITSLIGIYARLRFAERQQSVPDRTIVDRCQKRIQTLRAAYQQSDWENLEAIESLMADLTMEYQKHHPETTATPIDATDQQPKTVQAY